jgi:hypothetical protein
MASSEPGLCLHLHRENPPRHGQIQPPIPGCSCPEVYARGIPIPVTPSGRSALARRECIVRAQREGLELFAEFLVALTTTTRGQAAGPVQIWVECAYMLVSGPRRTVLRAKARPYTKPCLTRRLRHLPVSPTVAPADEPSEPHPSNASARTPTAHRKLLPANWIR